MTPYSHQIKNSLVVCKSVIADKVGRSASESLRQYSPGPVAGTQSTFPFENTPQSPSSASPDASLALRRCQIRFRPTIIDDQQQQFPAAVSVHKETADTKSRGLTACATENFFKFMRRLKVFQSHRPPLCKLTSKSGVNLRHRYRIEYAICMHQISSAQRIGLIARDLRSVNKHLATPSIFLLGCHVVDCA
ncbi:hypothetical protein EVAR_3469_1 [Eumeta japonica]|uniref:Uncharacterized protein n=1 Tax=Eumeta variegata TaxID=151549 RepID=A0A4C1SVC4_EUMVA|nr:hypothetical protein EVAR_3469_1 [Eumeta japonica]